jgi:hypothetical protein
MVFNPRLSLFLDLQPGRTLAPFSSALDRGFDPGAKPQGRALR